MDMNVVQEVQLVTGEGALGDRYSNPDGDRQVTLIEQESLRTIASHLGRDEVRPEELRRNILITGINLLALKGRQFRVGSAILEASGECHPCSRLETTLGPGGYNASRGLGGITARVLQGGTIRVGDLVVPLAPGEEGLPKDSAGALSADP